VDEAGRVRALRTLYRLSADGLLTLVKSEHGNRLQRVKLTDAGRAAVAELAGAAVAGRARLVHMIRIPGISCTGRMDAGWQMAEDRSARMHDIPGMSVRRDDFLC
jgi:DNA-binding PadR family transcriptional regulator